MAVDHQKCKGHIEEVEAITPIGGAQRGGVEKNSRYRRAAFFSGGTPGGGGG